MILDLNCVDSVRTNLESTREEILLSARGIWPSIYSVPEKTRKSYLETLKSQVVYLEERVSKLENQCGQCGETHPLIGHDDDCEWMTEGAECICGDNVMGPHGYVSISLDCLDYNSN